VAQSVYALPPRCAMASGVPCESIGRNTQGISFSK
jgi:hypothetical protein